MSELWTLSATDVAELVKTKQVSATEVTASTLSRLNAVNSAINAVVDEFPDDAMECAQAVDDKIARGEDPGILSGVPVTVKVNIDQQGRATTNGLRLQRNLIAEHDSPVVSNFRKAGAIIIGRTNTPAFSLRWFTRNSLHGHTRNPHDPTITPGGSSGGAAAAVATGIGALAHGTDIGGSIRYPAYACGIHGLRPTLGRIPAANFSGTERHVGGQLMAVSGPFARSIADLRLALCAMAAKDMRDPWWTPAPIDLPLPRKRVALCINPDSMTVAPEVTVALQTAAKQLQSAGWEVVEAECPTFQKAAELQAALWMAEFRQIQHVIEEEADPDASFVHQQLMKICPEIDLDGLMSAIQLRATLLREWQLFFDEYPVLLCPVSGELPFPDQLDVASPESFKRVLDAQLTQVGLPLLGLPGLAVQTGAVDGKPLGVQLIAGRYQENALLLAGEDIEREGLGPAVCIDPVVAR